MGIEKDINQSVFRNEHQKALINIIYTHNWMMEKMKAMFGKEDLTPQQFNILRILRGALPEPLSTLQIRNRMLDKMSDTSRIVDRLVAKGLAKKSTCREDKRLVDVTITPKGKKILEKFDEMEEEMDSLMGHISPDEAKTLNGILDRMRNSQ
ncbi:MAG: MarR family winged helix-turn-helix transcriptional regulator [Chitinophagaceae bacterium]